MAHRASSALRAPSPEGEGKKDELCLERTRVRRNESQIAAVLPGS